MNHKVDTGAIGWVVIGGVVLIVDAYALKNNKTTISRYAWGMQDHKLARWVFWAGWSGLTWHLVVGDRQILPEKHSTLYRRVHPMYALRSWIVSPKKS